MQIMPNFLVVLIHLTELAMLSSLKINSDNEVERNLWEVSYNLRTKIELFLKKDDNLTSVQFVI